LISWLLAAEAKRLSAAQQNPATTTLPLPRNVRGKSTARPNRRSPGPPQRGHGLDNRALVGEGVAAAAIGPGAGEQIGSHDKVAGGGQLIRHFRGPNRTGTKISWIITMAVALPFHLGINDKALDRARTVSNRDPFLWRGDLSNRARAILPGQEPRAQPKQARISAIRFHMKDNLSSFFLASSGTSTVVAPTSLISGGRRAVHIAVIAVEADVPETWV